MSSNGIKLNPDKTQLTVLGTRQQLAKITTTSICIGGINIEISKQVYDLGGQLDNILKMSPHVQNVTRSCFY